MVPGTSLGLVESGVGAEMTPLVGVAGTCGSLAAREKVAALISGALLGGAATGPESAPALVEEAPDGRGDAAATTAAGGGEAAAPGDVAAPESAAVAGDIADAAVDTADFWLGSAVCAAAPTDGASGEEPAGATAVVADATGSTTGLVGSAGGVVVVGDCGGAGVGAWTAGWPAAVAALADGTGGVSTGGAGAAGTAAGAGGGAGAAGDPVGTVVWVPAAASAAAAGGATAGSGGTDPSARAWPGSASARIDMPAAAAGR